MLTAGVLAEPTLVLNRSWYAIATTTVRHALGLLYSGSARAIRTDTYELHTFETWADLAVPLDEPHVRTVTLRIKVPEVIVLTHYDGAPKGTLPFTRRNLYRRDRNTCQYCGARPGSAELSIDHIVPRSQGGHGTWVNCVLACMRCNRRKANRTPADAGVRLRKKPIAPTWTPTLEVPIARLRQSWEKFVSERYWNVPLEP